VTLVVDVDYATKAPWVPARARLVEWAHAAAGRAGARAELAIRVVGPRESRRLNRAWRGRDKATNVLSFPGATVAGPSSGAPGRGGARGRAGRATVAFAHLGDLVICASVVAREAREQKKTLRAHWAHMVVHGTLHLLGFDHEHDVDAERMEGREKRVLARLGFPDPYRGT
jgi:probable rRNA maturation factor